MRVLVAPDCFGDTVRAAMAAVAFAAGWHDQAPDDELDLAPLSDGGPGLLTALADAIPEAERVSVSCQDLAGDPVEADVLRVGATVYVESAMACGHHLLDGRADVRTASTYGVGELIAAADAMPGVETVVVGLGGSGTNDGGAGMWAGLGAEPADVLRGGGAALKGLPALTPVRRPSAALVAASDVDNPLLGLHGATAVYGPQKGADRGTVMALELALERWADAVESALGVSGLRDLPGAGAAGGLGFGLLALGASRVSGIELVIEATGLRERIEGADLVVTGEGRYDHTSLRGKVVSGVARLAQEAGVPCVVVAGQSAVGEREAAAHGIDEVWSVATLLGSAEAALAAGSGGVLKVGREVARAWSRRPAASTGI